MFEMNITLMILSTISSIIFLMMNSPLSMGMLLMIQTILITLMTGLMSFTFWYAYMLFLIMIGGMLILFIYISSLTPNQKYSLPFNKIYLFLMFLLIFMMCMYIINSKQLNFNYYLLYNNDLMSMMNLEIEQNFNLKISLNKIYNKPMNWLMINLINYLLLTLLIVVKITNIKMGSLRKKN